MSRFRTSGFTLIEMLVSVALVLFIMVILTEAFGKGLDSFRTLKAVGDMETKLRTTASTLRRDLAADHFEGKRRLSDPGGRWSAMGLPREGFFRHVMPARPGVPDFAEEGGDSDGLRARRFVRSILHFTVKLRGNDRTQFFSAKLPPNSPLFALRTTFFDQPTDARFQDTGAVYSSQWAEVAYWLEPSGTANGTPLYTLYRSQFVICADNSKLNWPNFAVKVLDPNSTGYEEISCRSVIGSPFDLYINNPTDISEPIPGTSPQRHRRAFDPLQPTSRAATPLLSDVIMFAVWTGEFNNDGVPVGFQVADTHRLVGQGGGVFNGEDRRIAVTIRVWDQKSKQTRQMTIIQDL